MKDARHPTHFCETPRVALCGAPLAENDFELFYTNTTNHFGHVTCSGCRDALRTTQYSFF